MVPGLLTTRHWRPRPRTEDAVSAPRRPSRLTSADDGRLSIGMVAQRAGLRPSAIRYYESAGLIPRAARVGGRRVYDASVLDWLSLLALAREAGFTIKEMRELVSGFTPGTPPAARWQKLAIKKLREIDAMIARAHRMREVLRLAIDCGCLRLEDCGHLLPPSLETDARAP
jgi:MerR family transcriptional regulator, redox-sensitive transcriptional activator SoxR